MKPLSLREEELMPLLLQMKNLSVEIYCPIQGLPVRQWQILTPGPAFLKTSFVLYHLLSDGILILLALGVKGDDFQTTESMAFEIVQPHLLRADLR